MSLQRRSRLWKTPAMPLHYISGKTGQDKFVYPNYSAVSKINLGEAENWSGKVMIPAQVFEELHALSDTYGVDKRDYHALKDLSCKLGFAATHEWLHNNMKLFQQGAISGMEAEKPAVETIN